MNYRIHADGEMSDIQGTSDPADDYSVFATITEAKKALAAELAKTRDGLTFAIGRIRKLRVADVERESEC